MFLGVDFRCNTTLHAIEDWLDLPYMQPDRAMVKGPDGQPQVVTVTKCPMGRDFYRKESKVQRLLESSGLIHRGKVAAAADDVALRPEMVQVVTAELQRPPRPPAVRRPGASSARSGARRLRNHR